MAEANKFLFYFSVLLLAVSLVVFFFNVSRMVNITGKVTGTANLSIETVTSINFTTSNINWGSGMVTSGSTNATLNTAAGANNVTNGNWTGNTAGLVIENNGNKNVTLDLSAAKNATSLLGLGSTIPSEYQWNVSNVEVGSCTGGQLGLFLNVNGTYRACTQFLFNNSADTMRIDLRLVIPTDSLTGALSDTITATATAMA
jgi:hypothetical protein